MVVYYNNFVCRCPSRHSCESRNPERNGVDSRLRGNDMGAGLGLSAVRFFALLRMTRGEGLVIRHADFCWHHQLKFTGVGWPTSANLPTHLLLVDDNITQVALGPATADEDLNPRVKYWYEAML